MILSVSSARRCASAECVAGPTSHLSSMCDVMCGAVSDCASQFWQGMLVELLVLWCASRAAFSRW